MPPRRRRALPRPLTLLLSEGPGPHRDPRLGDPIYPRTPAALFALAGLAAAASARCPPAPPQSLSASRGLYCSSIFLDWQDVSGANNYTIYRNTTNYYATSGWVATALFGNSQFTDITAVAGQRYYYWVVATRDLCLPGSNTSGPSNVAQGWKAQDPLALTQVEASDGSYCSGVLVSWSIPQAPLGGTPTGFTIYRNTVNLYLTSSAVGATAGNENVYFDDTAEPGQAYYDWVRAENECGTAASSGDSGFANNLPPPINDTCATATPVLGGHTYVGNNVCASVDGPTFCSAASRNNVWYRFDAPADGTLHVDTCGSTGSFDTLLAIYAACDNLQNNLIACDNDACPDLLSAVTIPVVAGNDYYIRVAGYMTIPQPGATGNFLLNVEFTPTTGCHANCDNSTTAPVLNVNDFICFQTAFAAGCP